MERGLFLGLSAAFLTVSGIAHAGVHPDDIESRLAAVVGDWTLEGAENSYRELCEWYGDRAFVVCHAEDSSDGSKSTSILGYSQAENRFTYHNYSTKGASRSERGFPHGERGIVYTDERRISGGVARTQTTLTPVEGGRLNFRLERSVEGRP